MGHSAVGRQRKEDPSELEARMVHKASSRIAWIVTERKIMSQKTKLINYYLINYLKYDYFSSMASYIREKHICGYRDINKQHCEPGKFITMQYIYSFFLKVY